jgi:hypothetical protein
MLRGARRRGRAQTRLPAEVRQQLLDAIYAGRPFQAAVRHLRIAVSGGRWGHHPAGLAVTKPTQLGGPAGRGGGYAGPIRGLVLRETVAFFYLTPSFKRRAFSNDRPIPSGKPDTVRAHVSAASQSPPAHQDGQEPRLRSCSVARGAVMCMSEGSGWQDCGSLSEPKGPAGVSRLGPWFNVQKDRYLV